jgi:proline utilization trans-activator
MGMHLNVPDSVSLDPVAREHRHRVWWTAYIFDRMWSAILGYPHAISDEAIKVDLPVDTFDSSNSGNFMERAHFVARISLSRLSAHVIHSIYGPAVQETPLSSRVQSVSTDLRKWLEDLPAFLKVDSQRMLPVDPRASSLQLMFNQVRIQTVYLLNSADFGNGS